MDKEQTDFLKSMLVILATIISIPILIAAMWLTITTHNMDYVKFMPWLFLCLAVSLVVVSLFRILTPCYWENNLTGCSDLIIVVIVLLLSGVMAYCFKIPNASVRPVDDRAYKDYYLKKSWVSNKTLEKVIYSTIRESNVCSNMGRVVHGIPESADMFYHRKLNPIQSGCCKPLTECGYVYVNETFWNPGGGGSVGSNLDCVRWSNDQEKLCFTCDSCKAAVLAIVRKRWRTVGYILAVTLSFLSTMMAIIQRIFEKCNRQSRR